jgi:MYXO-CTERM domain-containing protein
VGLPRAGRLAFVLAVAVGLLVLTPSRSWACSCAAADTAEHVRRATTVASGRVDWTATDGQTRTYNVKIDAVYRGAAASSEKLFTSANESSCGLADLAPDQRYLFFIEGRHPGAMRVGLCGGTVPYDESVAREVEALTGPPRAPLPSQGHESPATSSGPPVVVMLLAGLALAGLAVGVVLRRRA